MLESPRRNGLSGRVCEIFLQNLLGFVIQSFGHVKLRQVGNYDRIFFVGPIGPFKVLLSFIPFFEIEIGDSKLW